MAPIPGLKLDPTDVDYVNMYEIKASGQRIDGVGEVNVYSAKPSTLFGNCSPDVESIRAFLVWSPVYFDQEVIRTVGGDPNVIWVQDDKPELVSEQGNYIGFSKLFSLNIDGVTTAWKLREYKSLNKDYSACQCAIYVVSYESAAYLRAKKQISKGKSALKKATSPDKLSATAKKLPTRAGTYATLCQSRSKPKDCGSLIDNEFEEAVIRKNNLKNQLKKISGETFRKHCGSLSDTDFEEEEECPNDESDHESDDEWVADEENDVDSEYECTNVDTEDVECVAEQGWVAGVSEAVRLPVRAVRAVAAASHNPYETRSKSKKNAAKSREVRAVSPLRAVNPYDTRSKSSKDTAKSPVCNVRPKKVFSLARKKKLNTGLKMGDTFEKLGDHIINLDSDEEELRKENQSTESDMIKSLLNDLLSEREKNALLEKKVQEAEEKIKKLDEDNEALVEIFTDERNRQLDMEQNLRKKWQDAEETAEKLRSKIKKIEDRKLSS